MRTKNTAPFIFFITMVIVVFIGSGTGFAFSKKTLAMGNQLSQSQETQKIEEITETLRNYHSAALMYHTENDKWPIGNNIQNTLDIYMDHPLDKTAFAEVRTVFIDKNHILIGLIGANRSDLTKPNVQAILESKAKTSRFFNAKGKPYTAGTAAVYTIIGIR